MPSTFAAGVKKWADKTLVNFEALRRATILELFSSVVLDTPVDEGRLRGNWQITSGRPASGEVEITDPEGNVTISKIQAFVGADKNPTTDKVTLLTNNLPYAYRIEYDGWSHTKAPKGMVRKNAIRISQNLKAKHG